MNSELSSRERQVCELLAQGLELAEAGKRLFISRGTANTHWQRSKAKLEIDSVVVLAHFALARGWIKNLYRDEPNG